MFSMFMFVICKQKKQNVIVTREKKRMKQCYEEMRQSWKQDII